MGFCVEATHFQRISIGMAIHEMHVCQFPSRVIRFRYKTTKWISDRMNIATPPLLFP
jgi:hypothetical protein